MSNILRNSVFFILRIFVYIWLSLWVIMRSDYLVRIVYENIYEYLLFIIAISLFMTNCKYDLRVLSLLARARNIRILYLAVIVIWVQFGLEWIISIRGQNYESFMFYEPIAVIMSAPVGIVVFVSKYLFNMSDMVLDAIVLWAGYFFSSLGQMVFIIHVYNARRRGHPQ
jgi:hypothetical protein